MRKMDRKKIQKAVELLLEGLLGKNFSSLNEDLKKTPQRVAKMYEEIFEGQNKDPLKELDAILEQKHDEIILLKNIPFYSICEHHLLPFIGKCHIAYIPDKYITGLSKIIRVLEILSHRPQVQERLTTQIADTIMKKLKPKGVMVIIEAEHLCMSIRGVKKPGVLTVTSCVRGIFRKNQKTRQEALSLIKE